MRKREIIGLLFLVVGASGVYLSVRQTPPQYIYLTASRDIAVGEIVSARDFTPESLYLSSAEDKYVSGDVDLSGHRSIRSISRGEIIPRAALTSEVEIEGRLLVTFEVARSRVPIGLKSGDLIDLFFFSIPTGIADDEEVKLVDVVEGIRIKEVQTENVQLDDKMTISAFFNREQSTEVLTLIARSTISVAQRFDNRE